MSVNVPVEPLRNLLSTYIHRKARIILRKWRNWVITFLFVSFYVTAMSPKLQCHCNVGYKKIFTVTIIFIQNLIALSHWSSKSSWLELSNKLVKTYTDCIHPKQYYLYCLAYNNSFTWQYHHSPLLAMHQWLRELEYFYLWVPRQKKVFLFFFDFETIASFTHVLYQYDNGAAQLVFRNLLSVHELKRTHGDH